MHSSHHHPPTIYLAASILEEQYIPNLRVSHTFCATDPWPFDNAMPPSTDDKCTPVINGHAGEGDEGQTISPICAALAERVNAFLDSDAPTPLLKAVQQQTRTALRVIAECLEKYRWVPTSFSTCPILYCLVGLIFGGVQL